jgi:hypothetical protein
MMPSFGDFSKRVKELGSTVEDNSGKLLRKVALAVDQTVVIATPVDTGRARSNWIANVGTSVNGIREAYYPGKERSTAGPNAQAAIDQAKATIAGASIGQEIHITNNLNYIGKLNDGSSRQAPAGFVEIAVKEGVAAFNDAKITVKGGVK